MQFPEIGRVLIPVVAVNSASTILPAPRSLASMAALPSPLELILSAKAIMEVVLPEPKNPLVTIYFVVIIYSS